MKRWLHDRPWIWIVLLMLLLFAGSIATLVIAELNKPELLKRSQGRPGSVSKPRLVAGQSEKTAEIETVSAGPERSSPTSS